MVPVLVLDVDEQEADKILLTHDPLAAMATVSDEQLQALLADVQTESAACVRSWMSLSLPLKPRRRMLLAAAANDRPEVDVPESYQVVVECGDEANQQAIYTQMRGEGYRCRVLTLSRMPGARRREFDSGSLLRAPCNRGTAMPKFDVTVSCPVHDSFRVQQVAGMFDVPLAEKATERFEVELPPTADDWQIGLIVGPSGSGKSTCVRHAFGDELYESAEWPTDRAVVDCFGDLRAARRRIVHRRRLRLAAVVGEAVSGAEQRGAVSLRFGAGAFRRGIGDEERSGC